MNLLWVGKCQQDTNGYPRSFQARGAAGEGGDAGRRQRATVRLGGIGVSLEFGRSIGGTLHIHRRLVIVQGTNLT